MILHSPADEMSVVIAFLLCTVIVSDRIGDVGCVPVKLTPPTPTVVASVPPAVHMSAIAPGGGA